MYVAYQIKGNDMYNNMQPTILSLLTCTLNHGVGSTENGCVAYQFKGNETYDNMQANILPLPWVRLKRLKRFFLLKDQMNRKVAHAHTMVIYTMGEYCRVL